MARHEIGFRLRNDLSELETLRARVDQFKTEAGIPEKAIFEINLILDELFTNIVSCGYRDLGEHWVTFTLSREGALVTLCVTDDGVPFNPTEAASFDPKCPVEERRIGGVGIHLVRSLTDGMTYRRTGDGNTVILRKKLV